jgi:hypothetical protein
MGLMKVTGYAIACKTEKQFETVVDLFNQMEYKSGHSKRTKCSNMSGEWGVYKYKTIVLVYDAKHYITYSKNDHLNEGFKIIDFDYFIENVLIEDYNY